MPFCPACGHSLEENALYCPACGRRLSTTSSAPGTVSPPPPPSSSYMPTNIPSVFGDADRKALRKITIFSAIILALLVISFVSTFFLNPFGYLFVVNRNPSSTTTFSFIPNFLTIFAAFIVVAIVLEATTYQQLRSAFKSLATVDKPHFRIPSMLTLLLMIVLPILLLGYLAILSGLQPLLNEISQNGGRTINSVPPGSLGPLLGGSVLVFIGGILCLAGLIGGPILGLWRVGSRYDDTLIKVAAILLIIPLLDIITPILLLVGAHNVKNRIFPPQMT
jgi:hypothetical protein